METDCINENEGLLVGTYKKIMSNIEFMHTYLEEPDIFKSDSASFKSFLIESFRFLYSDFHYLCLENKDIDTEIVKTSHVLQILPVKSKNISKLFDNMDTDDIKKFWLKFFTLFTNQNVDSIRSTFKTTLEEKISFFKEIKSTLNYIDYEIPTSPIEKFSGFDTSREIENWVQPLVNTANFSCEKTIFNTDEELRSCVDTEKLIIDLKHVMSAYESIKNPPHQQNNAEHVDFFCNLINLAETMSQYQNNLSIISSPLLDENNFEMLSINKDFSENLDYIKRCNDFLRTLKSKISSIKQN